MARITYSANIEDVRGKLGHAVHTKARSGKTLRGTAVPKRKATPAQTLQRSRMGRAAKAYKALTAPQLALWKAYAATLTKTDPVTGKHYTPAPGTVFNALVSKYQQVNTSPLFPPPPPTTPFAGDALAFVLSPDVGALYLTSTNANRADTITEFWLQSLGSEARRPSTTRYLQAGLIVFTEDDLTTSLSLAPGWYSVAVSYVRLSTGQKTPRIALSTLKIPSA